jgi:S1-C subfamily serine protease
MRTAFLCFVSAMLGAAVILVVSERAPLHPQAQAQVQSRRPATRPAARPVSSPPAVPAGPILTEPDLDRFARADDINAEELTAEEVVNVAVYEKVNKSVVHLTTKGIRADAVFLLDLPTEGAGSGSVLDLDGHILTNYHVVQEARQVSVLFADGKAYDAKFIGADQINDIAVIQVDAPKDILVPVQFADSRRLKVGMRVFALGNPFGLERTLTTGIISSLNRSLPLHANRTIKQIIQIDAAINPGNSGGPLLDTKGRLIGMNTAIASKTGQSSGVGFAIASNTIARIVPQLIANGKVTRPEIGISRVYETERGLLIARLVEGGPAEKAGLRGPLVSSRRRGPFNVETIDRSAADLIIAMDGEPVLTADDFLGYIESKDPGDQITLTVVRGGRELKVVVVLIAGE